MADEQVVVDILLEGEKDLLKASTQAAKLTRAMNALNKTLDGTANKDELLAKGASKVARSQKLEEGQAVRLTAALIKQQKAQEKLRDSQVSSGKKMSKFGIVTQQAGYQVQDFAVQVQGGTSAFVAFAQQGSQMAGIFGPWGAALGAALALLTPLARILWETGMNAEKLDTIYKELTTTSNDLTSATNRLLSFDYVGYYGDAADSVRGLETALLDLSSTQLKKTLFDMSSGLDDDLDKKITQAEDRIRASRGMGGVFSVMSTMDTQDLSNMKFKRDVILNLKFGNKAEIDTTTKMLSSKLIELEGELNNFMRSAPGSKLKGNAGADRDFEEGRIKDQIEQVKQASTAVESLNKLYSSGGRVQRRNIDSLVGASHKLSELAIKRLRHEKKFQQANEQELALKIAIFKKSEEYRLAGNDISVQNKLLEKHRELIKGQQELNDAKRVGNETTKDTGKALRGQLSAMKSLLGYVDGLDKKLAQSQAKLSDPSGVTSGIAGRQHDLMERLQRAGVDPSDKLAKEAQSKIDQLADLERQIITRKKLESAQAKLRSEQEKREKELKTLGVDLEEDPFEQERMRLKDWFTEKLELVRGNLEAENALREHYGKKKMEIDENERFSNLNKLGSSIGAVLTASANGDKKRLKAARVTAAAMALINTFEGASKALSQGGIAGIAWALTVVAAGMGFVNAIKSGSSSGSSGGGGASPTSPEVGQQGAGSPQRVMVQGLDPNSLFSGAQIQGIFDKIYEENKDRGYIFSVAP